MKRIIIFLVLNIIFYGIKAMDDHQVGEKAINRIQQGRFGSVASGFTFLQPTAHRTHTGLRYCRRAALFSFVTCNTIELPTIFAMKTNKQNICRHSVVPSKF